MPEEIKEPANDEEFLKGLEKVLGAWRSDILATVQGMVSEKRAVEEKVTDVKVSATKALQQELEQLKAQLKQEKLAVKIGNLAAAAKLHPDLLDLIIKSKFDKIDEVDGQFFAKSGDGEYKSLASFIDEYAKTPEGQRLVIQERQTTPLGLGSGQSQLPMGSNGKVDTNQMLFDAVSGF